MLTLTWMQGLGRIVIAEAIGKNLIYVRRVGHSVAGDLHHTVIVQR